MVSQVRPPKSNRPKSALSNHSRTNSKIQHSPRHNNMISRDKLWLQVLEDVNQHLRPSASATGGDKLSLVDECISHLQLLEATLRLTVSGTNAEVAASSSSPDSSPPTCPPSVDERKWDQIPLVDPPFFRNGSREQQTQRNNEQRPQRNFAQQYYAALDSNDVDDPPSDNVARMSIHDHDDNYDGHDGGGDTIIVPDDHRKATSSTPHGSFMDCRRILIRILSSQSDAFACKAVLLQKECRQWAGGAKQLKDGLSKVHEALVCADSAISRWMATDYEGIDLLHSGAGGTKTNTGVQGNGNRQDNYNKRQQQEQMGHLMKDAGVVEVSINFLTMNHDQYMTAARNHERKLIRQLQPEWASRDVVKAVMGEQRWRSNPNPKQTYAMQREPMEQELKDVQEALRQLEALDVNEVVQSVQQLRQQITGQQQQHGTSKNQSSSDAVDVPLPPSTTSAASPIPPPRIQRGNHRNQQQQKPQQKQQQHQQRYNHQKQRYNGVRPSPELLLHRVPWDAYPDPTHFGWKFTGSSGVAEFFEITDYYHHDADNDDGSTVVVKLDWYFTTATVKTSLHHPRQGRTQLFGNRVDPVMYRNILTNPRQHTGTRYHRRPREDPTMERKPVQGWPTDVLRREP